ncbi:MAG: hypothetical protein AAFW84_24840 [Cyanobacteria bacterium J06635_15]
MKPASVNQVFIAAIVCATAIALAAIILGFAGAIDINCKTNGCQLKIESGNDDKQLMPQNVDDQIHNLSSPDTEVREIINLKAE